MEEAYRLVVVKDGDGVKRIPAMTPVPVGATLLVKNGARGPSETGIAKGVHASGGYDP